MKKADYQMIGVILTILGILIVAVAIFAFSYGTPYRDYMGYEQGYDVYPYRDSFMPLLIVGIVLLAVGLGVIWRARQEKETRKP